MLFFSADRNIRKYKINTAAHCCERSKRKAKIWKKINYS